EYQQVRCGVADGRTGAEVAADRGAVADEAGGELREQLAQQRDLAGEVALEFGQRRGRSELDVLAVAADAPQFGQTVDGEHRFRACSLDVDLHAPVGGPGDDGDIGFGGEDVECLGERGRSPVAAEFAPGGVGAVEIGGRRGGGRLLA